MIDLILCLHVIKPEHQQLIVDAGALPLLVDLLKRHKRDSAPADGVIRRAANAIANITHENSSIKTRVRSVYLYFTDSHIK